MKRVEGRFGWKEPRYMESCHLLITQQI